MKGKPNWQCSKMGCGREATVGNQCEWCARGEALSAVGSGAYYERMPKPETRTSIMPTGQTRWMGGRPETEYTDGMMTWWTMTRVAA